MFKVKISGNSWNTYFLETCCGVTSRNMFSVMIFFKKKHLNWVIAFCIVFYYSHVNPYIWQRVMNYFYIDSKFTCFSRKLYRSCFLQLKTIESSWMKINFGFDWSFLSFTLNIINKWKWLSKISYVFCLFCLQLACF